MSIGIQSVTDDERDLLGHIRMWGSDGYPVRKVGSRHWAWSFRSLESRVVFPTKREAVASFERHVTELRDVAAGRPVLTLVA